MTDTEALMALDLEYRLTIAHRTACDCAPYLVDRREVLIPEVLKVAEERGIDAVDLFAGYARGVHARHADLAPTHGLAGRFAALMATVTPDTEDPR